MRPIMHAGPAQHMHIKPALRCARSYDTEFTCGAEVIVVNFLFDYEGPMDASLLRLDVAAMKSTSDKTLHFRSDQPSRHHVYVCARN